MIRRRLRIFVGPGAFEGDEHGPGACLQGGEHVRAHRVAGHHGAGKVVLRAAQPGTGIIAGGPMRAVFETLGINDIVAKSQGTANPYNMVRATFDALKRVDSPRSVASRRGLKVSELQARRGFESAEA